MSRVTGVAALLMATTVGACTGAPTVYNHHIMPSYTVSQYAYAAGRRDLYTVVRGDPLGMGDAGFEAAVIDALNRHQPPLQPTRFTAEPDESARPPYRTVVLFDPPRAVLPNALCQGSYEARTTPAAVGGGGGGVPAAPAAPRAADGTMRAAGAFCWGAGALTSAMVRVDGVESVDDPRFDAMISQLVLALFPQQSQDRDRCVPRAGGC